MKAVGLVVEGRGWHGYHAVPAALHRDWLIADSGISRCCRAEEWPSLHQRLVSIAIAKREGVVESWWRLEVERASGCVPAISRVKKLENIVRVKHDVTEKENLVKLLSLLSHLPQRLQGLVPQLRKVTYPPERIIAFVDVAILKAGLLDSNITFFGLSRSGSDDVFMARLVQNDPVLHTQFLQQKVQVSQSSFSVIPRSIFVDADVDIWDAQSADQILDLVDEVRPEEYLVVPGENGDENPLCIDLICRWAISRR